MPLVGDMRLNRQDKTVAFVIVQKATDLETEAGHAVGFTCFSALKDFDQNTIFICLLLNIALM